MQNGTRKNDLLIGTNFSDLISGLAGNDTLQGGGGGDTLDGGAGNDLLFGFRDYDDQSFQSEWFTLYGNDIDHLRGGAGNDIYVLDSWVTGELGLSLIFENPNEGSDTVVGSLSKARPRFEMPANVENYVSDTSLTDNGQPIYVQVIGNQSNNVIQTSPAKWSSLDKLTAGINETFTAYEKFYGGAGNDTLRSGAGDDFLDGGEGNDQLLGGADSDTLYGGTGVDVLTGGSGSDVFSFAAGDSPVSPKNSDQIKDFKFSENDQIQWIGFESVDCLVRDTKASSFSVAQANASADFSDGKTVSIQFVGNNALVFSDFDKDRIADSLVTLIGIKAGNATFADYAESGKIFAR